MTETLPSEGRIQMVTSRTGMKKAGGLEEGVLPYMAYTGMCRWTGYGF